jgi:membrane-associated protein
MYEDIILFIELLNPETIIKYGGIVLLLLIIFAETGLFFGFFLPGDSLLFIAGLLSDSEYLDQPVGVLIILLIIAAVSGTCVGFFFGQWAEQYLKHRKENFFYKRKYLDMANNFYQKHGMTAFIVGRFLPIIRTFIPILAGLIRVKFSSFLVYNIVGAAAWIIPLVLAGHWLGNIFPNLIHNVEFVILGMVILTSIPVIISYRKHRNNPLVL